MAVCSVPLHLGTNKSSKRSNSPHHLNFLTFYFKTKQYRKPHKTNNSLMNLYKVKHYHPGQENRTMPLPQKPLPELHPNQSSPVTTIAFPSNIQFLCGFITQACIPRH